MNYNYAHLSIGQVYAAVAGNAARVPVFQPRAASGLCQLPGLGEAGRLQPGRDVTWRGGLQTDSPPAQERPPQFFLNKGLFFLLWFSLTTLVGARLAGGGRGHSVPRTFLET